MTFLEAIQADWIFYIVNILVFVVVVMVTWLYARGQQMEAIAKLQSQIQQIQLQQNDKLFSLEDEFKLIKRVSDISVSQVYSLFSKERNNINLAKKASEIPALAKATKDSIKANFKL